MVPSLQESCLRGIAEFLWQSCLDSTKDDLLGAHLCRRRVLKSIPYLADELRARIFAHMLARDQISPEIVKALTVVDTGGAGASALGGAGWLQQLDLGVRTGSAGASGRMRQQQTGGGSSSSVDRCITNQGLAMVGAVESLVHLSLANCTGFTDAGLVNLKQLKQLRHLDLEGCKSITNDGLLALRDLDLVYLNLNDVNVSDQGCKVATEMINLATLCLSRTRVTHGLYHIIASALCADQKLGQGVEGNIGTDNNGSHIDSPQRKGLVSLQHLFLCGNDISAKDLTKLAELPRIETLDFMGCTNISPKSVADLKRALAARDYVASCNVVTGKKILVRYKSTASRPSTPVKATPERDPFALTSSPFGLASPFAFGRSPVATVRSTKVLNSAKPISKDNVPAAMTTNAFEGELWSCDQFITFLRKGSVVSSNHQLLAQQRKNVNRRWSSHRQSVSGIHISFREDSMAEGSPMSSSRLTVLASPSPQPWAKRKLSDRLADTSRLSDSNSSWKENQPPRGLEQSLVGVGLSASLLIDCSPITLVRTPKRSRTTSKPSPLDGHFDPFDFGSPRLASSMCSPLLFSPIAPLKSGPSASPVLSRLLDPTHEPSRPSTPAAASRSRTAFDFASPSPINTTTTTTPTSRLQTRKSLFSSTPSPIKPALSPRTPLSERPSPLRPPLPPVFPVFADLPAKPSVAVRTEECDDIFYDPLLPDVEVVPSAHSQEVLVSGKRGTEDLATKQDEADAEHQEESDDDEDDESDEDEDEDEDDEEEKLQRKLLMRLHHSKLKAMLRRMGKRNARGTKQKLVDMIIRTRQAPDTRRKPASKSTATAMANKPLTGERKVEVQAPSCPPHGPNKERQLKEVDGYIIIDDDSHGGSDCEEKASATDRQHQLTPPPPAATPSRRGRIPVPSTPLPSTLGFFEADVGDEDENEDDDPLLIPHISPISSGSSPRCHFGSPLSFSLPKTPSPSSTRQTMPAPRSQAYLSPAAKPLSLSSSPSSFSSSASTSTSSSPSVFSFCSFAMSSSSSSPSSSTASSSSSSPYSSSSSSRPHAPSPYMAARAAGIASGSEAHSQVLRRRLELHLAASPSLSLLSQSSSSSSSSSPSTASARRTPLRGVPLGESPYLQRHQRGAHLLEPPALRRSDRPGSESAMMEDINVPIADADSAAATVSRRREVVFFGDNANTRLKRKGLDDDVEADDHDDDGDYERQMVHGYFSSPSLLQRPCDESVIESPPFATRLLALGESPSSSKAKSVAMATTATTVALMSAAKRRKRRTSLLWDDIISVHEESPSKKKIALTSSSSSSSSRSGRGTSKEE